MCEFIILYLPNLAKDFIDVHCMLKPTYDHAGNICFLRFVKHPRSRKHLPLYPSFFVTSIVISFKTSAKPGLWACFNRYNGNKKDLGFICWAITIIGSIIGVVGGLSPNIAFGITLSGVATNLISYVVAVTIFVPESAESIVRCFSLDATWPPPLRAFLQSACVWMDAAAFDAEDVQM